MKLIDAIVPAGELVQHAKTGSRAAARQGAMGRGEIPGCRADRVYSNAGKMTFAAAQPIYRRET